MAVINYIWDELSDNLLMETDENNVPTVVYTHRPERFGQLLSQNRGGTTSYYHFDGEHSTCLLTDENENITDTYIFSAYGELVARTGTTVNPFGYKGAVGYYTNSATNDIYVRARTYEPVTGRWLSMDPLGFVDGPNLYRPHFVPGATDPTGMKSDDLPCVQFCKQKYFAENSDGQIVGMFPNIGWDTRKQWFCNCIEKNCPAGTPCPPVDVGPFHPQPWVFDIAALCRDADKCCCNCEQAIQELVDYAQTHPFIFEVNGCGFWVSSFYGGRVPESSCYKLTQVTWDYRPTDIRELFGGKRNRLQHTAIEVTICNGKRFFLDNGWWGLSDHIFMIPGDPFTTTCEGVPVGK